MASTRTKMSEHIETDPSAYRNLVDKYYLKVKDQIIKYQHPITGLFKLNPDDEKCDLSHVRDSVYCATALFALYQCYRKLDDTKGRFFELGKRTSKCMRAILMAWMSQSHKMEEFKAIQNPENSLHSVLSYSDGYPIEHMHYQHLQMDCVALFLIQLIQMTHSGIEIIFTKDEVVFVQNLIFYIERAYRIPDFGMWERGTKQNNGTTELSASSIGMAKAALEAATGFNLFGQDGDYSTVLFVDFDAHCRNRIILSNLLPRMSASKSQDMAMLPMIVWPSFATHRKELQEKIFAKMKQRFQGNYGFRRFTRDGYKTLVEDPNRKHYRLGEMKQRA